MIGEIWDGENIMKYIGTYLMPFEFFYIVLIFTCGIITFAWFVSAIDAPVPVGLITLDITLVFFN